MARKKKAAPVAAVAAPAEPKKVSPLLVNTAGLCELLGLSRTFVCRRLAEGKLPHPVNRGERKHLWSIREIEAWVEAGMPAQKDWEAIKRMRKRMAK